MIPLTALWLPILLSAVFVLIVSNILWMALPFWHRADYSELPDPATVLGALTNAPSGQYIAPNIGKMSPEEQEAAMKRPIAFLIVRNPAQFSLGGTLGKYFAYLLVVQVLIAYVAAATLRPGTPYLEVFRVVGTAGILAYSFNSIADSIWYGKPWKVSMKVLLDGVIYGLVAAGTFGWLWPK